MRASRPALGALIAVGLSLGSSADAATLVINDLTQGEITINHDGYWEGGAVSNGVAFAPYQVGETTALGEVATFSGTWISTVDGTGGAGVVYYVDPGQRDLVRARIDATWTITPGVGLETIDVTVTSAPIGSHLGLIPPAFIDFGVPISEDFVGFGAQFRDPVTTAPVTIPSHLATYFAADAIPDCEIPTLFLQEPDQDTAGLSDRGYSTTPFYTAEAVAFDQRVVVNAMRWWGIYYGANTPQADIDSFIVDIYEDVGGLPNPVPVASFYLHDTIRVGTGAILVSEYPEFLYQAFLPAPIALEAEKVYWIVISNDTTADPDDLWYWETSFIGDGLSAQGSLPSLDWFALEYDIALELCGFLTEPLCQPDFNGDGVVDGADLAQLLAFWGICPAPEPFVTPERPNQEKFKNTIDTGTDSLIAR